LESLSGLAGSLKFFNLSETGEFVTATNAKAWMLSKDYSGWLKEWNCKLHGNVVLSQKILMLFKLFTL
jgi:hypothetical protein